MKNILYILFFIVFACGCCSNKNKNPQIKILKDSMFNLFQKGMLREDAILVRQALRLSDTLLTYNLSKDDKIYCYYNRAMMFAVLGYDSMAIESKEMEMSLLPEDNLQRLSFNGLKNLHYNNKDSAEFYFNKALNICDALLKDKYDKNIVLNKIEITYYLYGEHKAKEFLKKEAASYPDDDFLKSVLDDWKEYKKKLECTRKFDFHSQ